MQEAVWALLVVLIFTFGVYFQRTPPRSLRFLVECFFGAVAAVAFAALFLYLLGRMAGVY